MRTHRVLWLLGPLLGSLMFAAACSGNDGDVASMEDAGAVGDVVTRSELLSAVERTVAEIWAASPAPPPGPTAEEIKEIVRQEIDDLVFGSDMRGSPGVAGPSTGDPRGIRDVTTNAPNAILHPPIAFVSSSTDSYDSSAAMFVKDYDGANQENHNALTIWQRNRPDFRGKNNPGGCIGFGGADDNREPNSADTRAAICYWEDGELGRLMLLSATSGATLNPDSPDGKLSVLGDRIEIVGSLDTNYHMITVGGNLPDEGRAGIILPDDTAISGLFPNQAGLYADDVAGTVEVFAIDEAGNRAQLSPHPSSLLDTIPQQDCEYPWGFHSANEYLGKEILVDWCGAVSALQQLTGKQFMFVFDIPKQDWYEPKFRACDKAFDSLPRSERADFTCEVDDPPLWLRERGVAARPGADWEQRRTPSDEPGSEG